MVDELSSVMSLANAVVALSRPHKCNYFSNIMKRHLWLPTYMLTGLVLLSLTDPIKSCFSNMVLAPNQIYFSQSIDIIQLSVGQKVESDHASISFVTEQHSHPTANTAVEIFVFFFSRISFLYGMG